MVFSRWLLFGLVAIVTGCMAVSSFADQASRSAHYCGLYAWMAASKQLGGSPDALALLEVGIVDSEEGSSVNALLKAAASQGLYAWAFERGTADMLEAANPPVLLLLRRSDAGDTYHHWVTWLGPTPGGNATWFDAEQGLRETSRAELTAQWTGVGIALGPSESALPMTQMSRAGWWRPVVLMGVSLFGVWLVNLGALYLRPSWGPGAVFAALLTLGLFGGVGFAAAVPGGLLSEAAAIAAVRDARAGSFTRELSTRAFVKRVEAEGLIVDARYPGDYEAGHVPGAINVPVSWTAEQTTRWVAGLADAIRNNGEVSIYCQSIGCGYDEEVAARLYAAGLTKVSVYPEGWEGWRRHRNEL